MITKNDEAKTSKDVVKTKKRAEESPVKSSKGHSPKSRGSKKSDVLRMCRAKSSTEPELPSGGALAA
jgi:hypothetical protein